MGLYDKVKERKKAAPAQGGLLQRSLSGRPAAARTQEPPREPVVRPVAVVRPARNAAALRAAPAAPPVRPAQPTPPPARSQIQESPPNGLASAISRIESGFDAPPLLFELIASALKLPRAALLVADYARGTFAPCALRGPRGGLAQPVTGWIESLLGGGTPRRLDARQMSSFGEFAAGLSDLRVMPFKCSDAPAGMLVFVPPIAGADDKKISAALAAEEICSLLEWSSTRLSELPPFPLENLDGVHPAGPSMLLSVSCADATAALGERAPSLNAAWLADILQRILGRLLAPLGRVGVRSGSPVAVLTHRSMDAPLLKHQISAVLERHLRSIRPLPAPVVTSLA